MTFRALALRQIRSEEGRNLIRKPLQNPQYENKQSQTLGTNFVLYGVDLNMFVASDFCFSKYLRYFWSQLAHLIERIKVANN